LYGQVLCVRLLHFIRAEQKFADFGALKAQIVLDAESARGLLK
jgi:riboflavin kinase/FMN adenylyltransferase